MMRNIWLTLIYLTSLNLFAQKLDDKELLEEAKSYFKPISKVKTTKEQAPLVNLGKALYLEKQLSGDGKMSCNECHNLKKYGVDNLPTSPGIKGKNGDRNSPTVYNAAVHIAQFWDGRAKDVEEQALGPILNPIEMALPSEEEAVKRLSAMEKYVQMFKEAFPKEKSPIVYKNIGKAIGAFERTLLTPAPFDKFLKGDLNALSLQQKRGLRTFIDVGCVACHDGIGVGGGQYQKLGLVKEYKTHDLGRYNVTKDEDDKFVFKVPGLRNIEKTGPYFHDGSIKELREVIRIMARHQLGQELEKNQVDDIHAFLTSLTADLKGISPL